MKHHHPGISRAKPGSGLTVSSPLSITPKVDWWWHDIKQGRKNPRCNFPGQVNLALGQVKMEVWWLCGQVTLVPCHFADSLPSLAPFFSLFSSILPSLTHSLKPVIFCIPLAYLSLFYHYITRVNWALPSKTHVNFTWLINSSKFT